MDLNHLNLRVKDAQACRDFYLEHFDFEPAFEAEDGFFLRNNDGFLLALVPAAEHQSLPEGFHVGFGLDTANEVRTTYDCLRSAGIAVTEVEDFDDYVTFRCSDPDGTEIEVFWEAG